MLRYRLVEGDFCLPDGERYRAFGLEVITVQRDTEINLCTICDISTDERFVAALAELFTYEQLELVHLMDVLQDIL